MGDFKTVITKLGREIPASLWNQCTLVGSVNLYFQGVDVTPKKDIDFATDFTTVQELNKFFAGRTTKFCSQKNGDSFLPFSYLCVEIDSYEIEFFDAADYGESYYLGEISAEKTVELPDLNLRGLNLDTELKIYKKSGKEEKAKAIEDFIKES